MQSKRFLEMANAASTGDIRQSVSSGGPLVYSGATWEEISIDPKLLERIERIEKINEKITERLAILEDPSPEQLEQFKVLKDLHEKYKFVESLCEGKDDTS
jgi:hypothetical protein